MTVLYKNFRFIALVSTSSHESSQVSLFLFCTPPDCPRSFCSCVLFVDALLNQLVAVLNAAPMTTDASPRAYLFLCFLRPSQRIGQGGIFARHTNIDTNLWPKSKGSVRNGIEQRNQAGLCLLRCLHFHLLYFTWLFTLYAPSNRSLSRMHTMLPSRYKAHNPFSSIHCVIWHTAKNP